MSINTNPKDMLLTICDLVDISINRHSIARSDAVTRYRLGVSQIAASAKKIQSYARLLDIPVTVYVEAAVPVAMKVISARLNIHAVASQKVYEYLQKTGDHRKIARIARVQHLIDIHGEYLPDSKEIYNLDSVLEEFIENVRKNNLTEDPSSIIAYMIAYRVNLGLFILMSVPEIASYIRTGRLIMHDVNYTTWLHSIRKQWKFIESLDRWKEYAEMMQHAGIELKCP